MCITFLILFATTARGQTFFDEPAYQTETGLEVGVNLQGAFPQGAFKDNLDTYGFGINGHLIYQIRNTPVALGINIGFITYGSETRRAPFSTTIPDVTVEVTNTNNIFNGHLMMRLQPPSGSFRPYADALFGFNYLFTETQITDSEEVDDEIASSTNFDDSALSYGFGGGLRFKLTDLPSETGANGPSLHLDLGGRYLFGGEAQYLKEGSIEQTSGGNVDFDVQDSATDILHIYLGVIFQF